VGTQAISAKGVQSARKLFKNRAKNDESENSAGGNKLVLKQLPYTRHPSFSNIFIN
jgi:hypothetical protein